MYLHSALDDGARRCLSNLVLADAQVKPLGDLPCLRKLPPRVLSVAIHEPLRDLPSKEMVLLHASVFSEHPYNELLL